jgi:diaminopimelate decarboxylase
MKNNHRINLSLLPSTSEVTEDGQLFIGGVSVSEVVNEFGTPVFIYDETHIKSKLNEAKKVWGKNVAYGSKAFICKYLVKLIDQSGIRIDVSTGGELSHCILSGFDPSRIVFHGNNKSVLELTRAISYGVGTIVIDSIDELERIEKLAVLNVKSEPINTMLRLTPGIEAHTHEYVKTGQHDSKFGFSIFAETTKQAVNRILSNTALKLSGFHFHIGSQIFKLDGYLEAMKVVAEFIKYYDIEELVIGGGLGVPYLNSDSQISITDWAKYIKDAAKSCGIDSKVEITAEPGRSIVAAAAITVYTIGTIKKIDNIRTYVSVDGGMSDNPRPVLYSSGYEAFLPNKMNSIGNLICRVVGKHCESGDVLVNNANLPENIEVGDLLATPVTGAYGYSMASNYNKVPRPAVVFVEEGQTKEVIRRETLEDLIRLDL